jgi:hypothetical protein
LTNPYLAVTSSRAYGPTAVPVPSDLTSTPRVEGDGDAAVQKVAARPGHRLDWALVRHLERAALRDRQCRIRGQPRGGFPSGRAIDCVPPKAAEPQALFLFTSTAVSRAPLQRTSLDRLGRRRHRSCFRRARGSCGLVRGSPRAVLSEGLTRPKRRRFASRGTFSACPLVSGAATPRTEGRVEDAAPQGFAGRIGRRGGGRGRALRWRIPTGGRR